MKRVLTCLALLFSLLYVTAPQAHACDRTNISLNYLYYNGATSHWTINLTLAIGGGSQGTNYGGNSFTGNIQFAFRNNPGETPAAPTVHSFSPGVITSDYLQRSASGAIVSVPTTTTWPYGPECGLVRYNVSAGFPTGQYVCITPTTLCGPPHSDYQNFTFEVSPLPDTIYALGLEAAGNSRAGCLVTDRSKILLTPSTAMPLPVIWGSFTVTNAQNGVLLEFSTVRESNNQYFGIQRAEPDGSFREIGQVQAVGNSQTAQKYLFTDHTPYPGANHYKIRQYNLDGKQSETQVLTVQFTPPQGMALLNLYPVPATEYVDAGFRSAAGGETVVEVYDVRGVLVFRNSFQALPGYNSSRIDVTVLPPGSYAVLLRCGEESLRTRFVKRS